MHEPNPLRCVSPGVHQCVVHLQVQEEIGAKAAVAFDITAACSGFVVALLTAAQFVRTGARKNVVIVGADALSRYVDWTDRGACLPSKS